MDLEIFDCFFSINHAVLTPPHLRGLCTVGSRFTSSSSGCHLVLRRAGAAPYVEPFHRCRVANRPRVARFFHIRSISGRTAILATPFSTSKVAGPSARRRQQVPSKLNYGIARYCLRQISSGGERSACIDDFGNSSKIGRSSYGVEKNQATSTVPQHLSDRPSALCVVLQPRRRRAHRAKDAKMTRRSTCRNFFVCIASRLHFQYVVVRPVGRPFCKPEED